MECFAILRYNGCGARWVCALESSSIDIIPLVKGIISMALVLNANVMTNLLCACVVEQRKVGVACSWGQH